MHALHATVAKNNNNKKTKNEERDDKNRMILDELNQMYDYEGRIDSCDADHRCGFCVIVGAPNMGKSTLMNALLEEELCVATRRPQTTRHAILGVISTPKTQLCLVDTPGVIGDPSYKLQEGMMEAVMGAFYDADLLLVVTDMFSTPIPDDNLFAKVQQSSKPIIVVINKCDLQSKVNSNNNDDASHPDYRTVSVEEAVLRWRTLLPQAKVILPISAAEGSANAGVEALRAILLGGGDVPGKIRNLGRPVLGMLPLASSQPFMTDEEAQQLLPLSPPMYHPETLTDRPERFFCSEIIRAAIFQILKKEVPYCCEVRITGFKEPKPEDRKQVVRMMATVLVERESQKAIVVGKGGDVIKQVGTAAREKLEEFLQTQVFLDLTVKVDKDWRKSEKKLKQFGYMK